jgi:hypothetical protein
MPDPDDYTGNFLSPNGHALYLRLRGLFPGASWILSPFFEPKTGKNVWTWWEDHFKAFAARLDKSPAAQALRDPAGPAGVIPALLAALVDPERHPPKSGANKEDLTTEIVKQMTDLQTRLIAALKVQRPEPGLRKALEGLRNATLTAGMGSIAQMESTPGRGFADTFNELFVRDRCEALYELVGDPPKDLLLGSDDTTSNYTARTTENIRLRIGELDVAKQMAAQTAHLDNATRVLAAHPKPAAREKAEQERRSAMVQLAYVAQVLGEETQRLAVNHDRSRIHDGWDAAALCGVLAEGMRGVLGLERRGTGKLTGPASVRELLDFGQAQLKVVKDDEEKRDDPTDPRRFERK